MPGLYPRPYTIEEYTRTVCPQCAKRGLRSDDPAVFIDGALVSHGGSIWMKRWCPIHGETESLYEEDASLWRGRSGWLTPTSAIIPDRADNFAGFPEGYRSGLPASHGQHSCILLLNLTENCNFRCPTCYASALDPGAAAQEKPTLDELLKTVDVMTEREGGKLGVVMLSGGEPTLRRDLKELILALCQRPITRVMLNTNGRRIAKDDEFLAFLADHRDKVEVYLQFDGLQESTHLALRGEPLLEEKKRTLTRLNEAKLFTTLVMTVKKGVNDGEIKDVFDFGRSIPYCSGINFQPVFGSGRNSGIDGLNRVTPTGVINRLGMEDCFIPLPCSHRDCCDIAYFVKSGKGEWKSLMEVVGRDRLKKWIHLVSNTISFENVKESMQSMIKEGVLQRLFGEGKGMSSLQMASDMMKALDCGPGCDCLPGVKDLFNAWWPGAKKPDLEKIATNTFRVTVKMFMDAHTFHEARIRQCCVHVGSFEDDPRRTSFCWRWLFEDSTDFPERVSTLPMR